MTATLADIRLIELPHHVSESGELVVMEGGGPVPFQIARVFFVHAPAQVVRGRHAHRRCIQLMLCSAGRIEVVCDDGTDTSRFMLENRCTGLLVPPGLWASQQYVDANSGLVVLCNRPYEADDYIRDYAEFKAYRAQQGHSAR